MARRSDPNPCSLDEPRRRKLESERHRAVGALIRIGITAGAPMPIPKSNIDSWAYEAVSRLIR